MANENLSVLLPPKMRAQVEKEARRAKRSRSAVVRDALQLYFRLRQIGIEEATDGDRSAIAEGRQAYAAGDVIPLSEWRHAVGISDK